MIHLSGKTALVTGSTRGIGKATALRLAEAGATVIVTGRNEDRAREVAKDIKTRTGSDTFAVELDLGDRESIERAMERITEAVGTVDILVNNAGVNRDALFLRMKYEDWDEIIRINLTGTFLVTQLAVKGMLKKRWGRIINISSVVAFIGNFGQANYSTAKAGLVGFTKTLAKELATRNITVNAVAPGFIETDMTENLPEEIKNGFLSQIPMDRYITGEVIHVNGGLF